VSDLYNALVITRDTLKAKGNFEVAETLSKILNKATL